MTTGEYNVAIHTVTEALWGTESDSGWMNIAEKAINALIDGEACGNRPR